MTKGKNILKSKPFIISLAVVVVLAIVAIVLTKTGIIQNLTTDKNVLAVVGGEKITTSDLNTKIYGLSFKNDQTVDDQTKKILIDELVEEKIILNASKRLGINISSGDIEKKTKETLGYFDSLTQEQKDIALHGTEIELKREKIKEKVISWREGSFANIRMDKHFDINLGGR